MARKTTLACAPPAESLTFQQPSAGSTMIDAYDGAPACPSYPIGTNCCHVFPVETLTLHDEPAADQPLCFRREERPENLRVDSSEARMIGAGGSIRLRDEVNAMRLR